jgi:hypothetical protein
MKAWYRAESDANDAQGTNDGTAGSAVTFAAGKVGQAFSFDGSGDITLGNPTDLQSANAVSADVWVKPDNATSFMYTVGKWADNGAASSWLLAINFGTPRAFVFGSGGDGFTEVQGPAIPTGADAPFTHVAFTYSSTDVLRLYVNGAEVSAGVGENIGPMLNTTTREARIGGGVDIPSTQFFKGLMDEVEIFDRALSPTEVKELYQADTTGKCVPPVFDFGDAPDSYGTVLASSGARHTLVPLGPRLGELVDADSDGVPGAAATGDDLAPESGPDDEDGLSQTSFTAGTSNTVNVTVTGIGEITGNAWIDVNRNNTFENNATERRAITLSSGVYSFNVTLPAAAPAGTYYARLRVCSTQTTCDSPTGLADDGEVEDYALTVAAAPGGGGGGGGGGSGVIVPPGGGGGGSGGDGGGGGDGAIDFWTLLLLGLPAALRLRRRMK